MNVSRVGALAVFGLIMAMIVGGLLTSWQESSRLYAKPPSKEVVFFDVSVTGDMVLVGTFNPDGSVQPGLVAEGRAGDTPGVVVNRPSPALLLDFLAELDCFTKGEIYSLDGGGALQTVEKSKGAEVLYFFQAKGKDGSLVNYRIDGDAFVVPDTEGSSFPTGDPKGYTVFVDNIRVSQDTGKKGNACEGSFPDASALIRLDRK